MAYETRCHEMSIKSGSLFSAIPPQSCSRGVLYKTITFGVFTFLKTAFDSVHLRIRLHLVGVT